MSWWLRIRRRRALDEDIADEIAFHRHLRARDHAPPPFGNETIIRERMRELWTFEFIETTLRDLGLAARGLRRNPAFAVTIITSMALAIGAAAAIFTAADIFLLRPLPYRDPGTLVMLFERNPASSQSSLDGVSPDNFLEWRSRNSVFEGMAYIDDGRSVFSDGRQSAELHVQRVPPEFFHLLGVQPARGGLASAHDPAGAGGGWQSQVVISYRLWQNWFGGAPDVIGRSVEVDAFPRTIAAVMPQGFTFGDRDVDLWPYMEIYPSGPHDRGARTMQAIARLKPGVDDAQAQAQMAGIALQLQHADPDFNKDWTVTLVNLQDAFSRHVRASLLVLLAAVTLLLAVACANAANLLLARYAARLAEIAIRTALGAGRSRLIRQFLTESLLLAACSGVLGVALGRVALAGLVALAPPALTQTADVVMNWRIVLFALGLSGATGLVFGLGPAIVGARSDVAGHARAISRSRSTSGHRARSWIIASEIAMAVVLLATASVLFRSLMKLQHVDPGLNPRNVLTFHFRVKSPADVTRFAQAISEAERLPGVISASATSFLPFEGSAPETPIAIVGSTLRLEAGAAATVRTILPGYFQTMGIPLIRGRDFTDLDRAATAPLRFVVNNAFARKYLGSRDPLAALITVSMARGNPPGQVVGVVGDVREGSLRQAPVPTVYYLHSRLPYGQMTLVMRTAGDPLAVAPAVRRIVHDLDPQLAVAGLRTMEATLEETFSRERFLAILMIGFSTCALLLAGAGIYGVLAYSISQRTREIGIRQAIGADASQIVMMVLAGGARFVVSGMIAGVVATVAVTRGLSSLLFETSPDDPTAFGVAMGILLCVALIAAYIPARRASRLDPMQALRLE